MPLGDPLARIMMATNLHLLAQSATHLPDCSIMVMMLMKLAADDHGHDDEGAPAATSPHLVGFGALLWARKKC